MISALKASPAFILEYPFVRSVKIIGISKKRAFTSFNRNNISSKKRVPRRVELIEVYQF